jgi:hypothetical protein
LDDPFEFVAEMMEVLRTDAQAKHFLDTWPVAAMIEKKVR